ncbi:hypothetical protein TMatcc_001916 [Talaromyces marneffei ATCC 18224]|uniref:Uncharacterized protein n=1 Tax=Talaromyces marneffei (strain ATCC 18224 / CBS 334.59 / QM 7333) TaxID=441960 RepID=B6QI57_TALMQ|nr:uncharacterized protein EYB26_006896 [Talaromyces marneffei]EEA23052.1 conserved hypothetical protein [Talaromyces marneffei ATCC 18224]KAE8551919.1 hypothetical protein EYB25_005810 [Talaromyces marneffei]QGA19208.1 hypothetical protein EYB26_006896 [Talaromyces marneffei]
MFCLRSWLPLLFIPTNASPLFILSFVVLTYILHRPCIYCSALLLILFTSSCQWSDRCFFDLRGDWFAPRFSPPSYTISSNGSMVGGNATMSTAFDGVVGFGNESFASFINSTATAVAGAAMEEIKRRTSVMLADGTAAVAGRGQEEWTGIGLEWLRSLLGRREWTIPCIDVKVQL